MSPSLLQPKYNLGVLILRLGLAAIFIVHGYIKVIVDAKSAIYLQGTQLDFQKDLLGGSFKFVNPNAEKTCGCGESFSA